MSVQMIDVNSIIDNLATKFGTTVPYLIDEMKKYYIISESTWMIVCLAITILSLIIAKKLIDKGTAIKKKNEWDDWEIPFTFGWATYAITFAFGIGFVVAIKHLVQWCITPTASAMAEVLKMISR